MDESWAARHDGHTLGTALSQAARRAAAAVPAVHPADRDGLLADVFATQRDNMEHQGGPGRVGPYGQERYR